MKNQKKEVDIASFKQLCKIANIELKEEEEEIIFNQLNEVIDYLHQLDDLDTRGVNPCHHAIDTTINVMRNDEVHPDQDALEYLIKNAPEGGQSGGMIRVFPLFQED